MRVWSEEACEELKACFECTDWTAVYDNNIGVDTVAELVTDYANFCVDMIIPCKTFKLHSNNEPWVTKEIKTAINNKKAAFTSGNREKIKSAQKDVEDIKHCACAKKT